MLADIAWFGLAAAMTLSGMLAPAPVELPTPTGRFPVGTTSWRLTDSSRQETFTGSGEFRQVEVIAWHPAAGKLGGHSMGGVTSGQFCLEDRRCRAGLNLDGIPQYGGMIDKSMPRPFLMVYSASPGRIGASDVIYKWAARPHYRVDVADTRHLDFSDMAFWGGTLRQRPVLGTIAPARVNEITGVIVRQYFDQELLGRRSPLLAGTFEIGISNSVVMPPAAAAAVPD